MRRYSTVATSCAALIVAMVVWNAFPGVATAQSSLDQPPYGKMDFETFRVITTGMTETEVLTRAGEPFHVEFLGCGHSVPVPWCPLGCVFCQTRWDYIGDSYAADWIFEVKFLGNRVFETNNYRRTP